MSATVALRRIARMAYGDSLAAELRVDGKFPVVGSGGVSGSHDRGNFNAPGIVIGRKGSYGSIHWVSSGGFAIDTAYYIDDRLTSANLRWLYYALQAVDLRGVSQDVGVPGLSRESAYEVAVPLPPRIEEQRRIADFLDAETARIDSLVRARSAQIAVIGERLDVLRDSIFEGDDAEVDRIPLMYLTDPYRPIVYGIVQAGPDFPGGVPYVKTGDLKKLRPESLSRTSPEIHQQFRRAAVRPGDLVMAMRASIGAVAMVPPHLPEANLTQGTARIAAADGVSNEWLLHALQTRRVREQFDLRAVGSTFRTLNIWDLRRITLVGASMADQAKSVRDFKVAETAHMNIRDAGERQIRVLAERRQSLITAAVTGQFDVTTASGRNVTD
ncbi:restriction endonuclease subunit S [Streptomyces rhizosphaericola]|uniref:Restriction endonuclease subunit S n=1 Tax=Streptomyces rhizosphaericola TaxID=2564098 RepID=A0ABY2PMU6_9ACTN|nr:restriction endonuclease subunit S [Streptomyces rhizosphaericola]TGZ12136.1 restriction endonuclease subunit S [Streptomyces rhizosphaericola]